MALSPSFRRLIAVILLAILLAHADTIQAMIPGWDRRKKMPEPFFPDLPPEQGITSSSREQGDDSPDLFIRKARPVPKVPSAYKPQPKPQPKPRPGAKATPLPGAPAPTPPITRPT